MRQLIGLHVSTGSPGLAWVLLTYLATDGAQLDAHRSALIELYIDKVLSARERPSAAALAQWAHLAALLTLEDLRGTLLPAIQRLAKRSPDVVLPSVAALLAAVRADLSGVVPGLMATLLQLARHARDTVR